jgi:amidase
VNQLVPMPRPTRFGVLAPPPHDTDLMREGQMRLLGSPRVSLIAPALAFTGLAVPVGRLERLRPGVQIVAGRFREDLSLDARGVIEPAEGWW